MDSPPVDLNRLLDLTDGNRAEMRELVELYLQQTGGQLVSLKSAIEEQSAEKIHRLGHTAAGASATCGITEMATLLREIEMCGRTGRLHETPALLARAEVGLQSVHQFFEDYFKP